MRVLNGNYHQGQIMSNVAGFQCTAIALYALIFASTVRNPYDIFNPEAIDQIVLNGHRMYEQILCFSNDLTPRYLGHWELPSLVQFNDEYFNIHRYENIFHGIVGAEVNFPYTTVTIEEALPRAYSISNYFIATFGSNSIAIFRFHNSNQWYIFDSHSRNDTGVTSEFGTATFIEFADYEQCLNFLIQNYNGLNFEITPIVFEKIIIDACTENTNLFSNANSQNLSTSKSTNNDMETDVSKNMTNDMATKAFNIVQQSVNVFNGNYHQGQIMSNVAGFQCTAIALYALVFTSTLRNPYNIFNPEAIDQIVLNGHQMYEQILCFSNDLTPRYLGHWELPSLVQFNDEYFNIHRYENIFHGIVGAEVNFPYTTVTIEEALPRAYSISNYFIATFGSNSIAIFRFHNSNQWYIFDSHSRNDTGVTSEFGTATFIEFADYEQCLNFLIQNYNGLNFEITPIVFEKIFIDACTANTNLFSNANNSQNLSPSKSTNNDMETDVSKNMANDMATEASNIVEQSVIKNLTNNEEFIITNKIKDCNRKNIYVHLDEITGDNKKYENHIRMIANFCCQCCDKKLFEDQIKKLPTSYKFFMSNGIEINCNSTVCSRCASKLIKNKSSLKYTDNNLDAGCVPDCLQNLDIVQRRLISQIQSYMTIIILPGGQYAEKGLTIHFPINLECYFNSLQRLKNESMIVVTHANGQPQLKSIPAQKVVNFEDVCTAISWLKSNNILYYNYPDLHVCKQNYDINSVKENGTSICLHNDVRKFIHACNESATIPVNYSVPNVEIDQLLSHNAKLEIPVQFEKPTWLYQIPHGEEMAFPWLFPFGKGGMYNNRSIKLTALEYYNYRLYHKDDRWRKNITFLMYAVNHMEQTKLSNEIEIQMRLHKSDGKMTVGSLLNNTHLSKIKTNSFMFMKKIRGTVAYWADILHNLLATVKSLGPPTLFVTLSADDNNWPELKMLLNDMSYEDAINSEHGNENLKKDPLFSSLHFERRWKAFFKYILMGKEKPVGHIEDYFARIEYQNRGSPHLHIFLWITNAPTLISSTSLEITQYIDKVISTSLPNEKEDSEMYFLVKRLQIHHHTTSCKRHNVCRFGFPKTPCMQTKILSNVDITNQASKGHFYQTKRTNNDIYVNAYNPTLLKRWRANMDIQMVSGVHGLAYYVCNYIAKAEPDDLKQALNKVFEDININMQQYSIKKQMHMIGNCVLKSRRLSAQEAAARIGHLQLVWSSRTTVFVNTRPNDERFRVLLPKKKREQLSENSTEIFCSNIIDYYMDRPVDLEGMSLFKFASWYKLSSSDDTNVSSRSSQRIRLLSHNKILQKRRKSAIIRTPKFQGNSEQYYFSLLMLHLPFRNESSIILPYSSAKQAFLWKNKLFDLNDIQFEAYLTNIERTVRLLTTTRPEIDAVVAPNTHETEDIHEEISPEYSFLSMQNVDPNVIEQYDSEINNNDQDLTENFHSLQVNMLSPEEIESSIEKLTDDQRNVFKVVEKHFSMSCTKPLYLFVSGGAGTGKSFLICTLVEWLRLFTSPFVGADPVLVCGPTGMSAKNIRGKTLHSAFKLPVQHGYEPTYKELSSKTLQDLRKMYRAVHTVIIDEISMVSSQTLLFIHRRLSAIKNNDDYFGGINVILIGDFHQLKPVRGRFAFQNFTLWSLFDTYILKTNMRQTSPDGYSDLLNRIRIGTYTMEDIQILTSRLIDKNDPRFDGVLRVYPTLKQVNEYNQQKQNNLLQKSVEITADHNFGSDNSGQEDNIDDFIPIDDRDAGGLPRKLVLSFGTRVMLIRNIATEHGLINGALGFVRHIEMNENKPFRIYVQFDDISIGRLFYDELHNATLIEQISQEFYFKGKSITRTQFPLLPAWASTIHKVQGITCDRIVLGIGKSVFAKGQIYVGLSRVRTLEGLAIESFDPTKIKADEAVLKFYNSLPLDKKHIHD